MKLSTIYRRAAERVFLSGEAGGLLPCCSAIHSLPRTVLETGTAAHTFAEYFGCPEKDVQWFGGYTAAQNARVVALLLAAEIASDEERSARKTARISK